jgi:hypothetical protein
MNGNSASHANGPTVLRRSPIEMFMNARTTAGSKWLPAQRDSSSRAAAAVMAVLYERTAVITS